MGDGGGLHSAECFSGSRSWCGQPFTLDTRTDMTEHVCIV